MVIVRKLIDRKGWLIYQNEATRQYFALIRWVHRLEDWAPHSMTKNAKIDLQTPPATHFFLNFEKPKRYLKSAYQTAWEKMRGAKLWVTNLKRSHPSAEHPGPRWVAGKATCDQKGIVWSGSRAASARILAAPYTGRHPIGCVVAGNARFSRRAIGWMFLSNERFP